MSVLRKFTSCLGILVLAGTGLATEGGGGAYPNGAEDLMSGALPPPGSYLKTYGLYYRADEVMDGLGEAAPIDFDLEVAGVVLRYIHVGTVEVAGGLWAQQVFVPVLNVDVSTPAGADDQFGLGDLIVDPFVVSWHKPPFHYAVGTDIYVPVGAYDQQDLANVGRNYWTFEPVAAVTYLNEQGLDVSLKLMYDINLENPDTDYTSGDEFHADFAVGLNRGPWRAGLSGFYYDQVTGDDAPAGVEAGPDGYQIGLGPVVSYQAGPVNISAKYQAELETKGRPEGEHIWLNLTLPL